MRQTTPARGARRAQLGLCLALALLLPSPRAFGGVLDDARKLIDAGDHTAARRLLEHAISNPAHEAAGLVLLTTSCNALSDYEAGIRYGKRAVGLLPESSEAHFQYAQALRIKMSSVSKMKAMFSLGPYKKTLKRAIELDPRNVEARREEIGFLTHAPGMAGGDKQKARERIDELMRLDWRAALLARAELEAEQEQYDSAVKSYAQVLDKHPDDAEGRYELAFLLQRLERYREADEHFARLAGGSDPYFAFNALYQRGRSRIFGEYEAEQAAQFLQRFIETCADDIRGVPSKSNAYWRLGNAYEMLERTGDARRAYERAVALDGSNDQAKKALKALPSS
jgi:tetratricopeptide (TPR) repeat protein